MSTGIYKNGQFVKTAGMYSGYEVFTPATETTDGSTGLVVAPLKGDQNKYLKGDGTWATVETGSNVTVTPTLTSGVEIGKIKVGDTTSTLYGQDTTYSVATSSADGLMPKGDRAIMTDVSVVSLDVEGETYRYLAFDSKELAYKGETIAQVDIALDDKIKTKKLISYSDTTTYEALS